MSKQNLVVVSTSLLILLVLSMTGCLFSRGANLKEEIPSPNNAYKVTIERNKNDKRDYVSLTTTFLKSGKEYHEESPIHYEGVFDTLFEYIYPDRLWLADNVLWLGDKKSLDKSNDRILIKNKSNKTIQRLRLRTDDRYFIYDIDSKDSIEIPVVWTNNGRKQISIIASAIFADGTDTPVKYQDFPYPNPSEKSNVQVLVSDSEILINKL